MRNSRAISEIGAVVLTAALHPVFVEVLHQRAVFIGVALGGWVLYLAFRCWKDKGTLARWGFRQEGLVPAFIATSVFGAIALAVISVVAVGHRSLVFRQEMLPLFLLYPIWGTLQQLLVQGIFVRTVREQEILTPGLAVTAASILFAAVHLPDLPLAGATFLMGAVFTVIYLLWRNLWPLGLYHGWLGVFYYYWVLDRNPWAEMFGAR